MKIFLKILGLTILDYLLIWFWVKKMNPEPSISIAIIYLVPFVFAINIVIGIILLLFKNNNSKLFLVNSIIASILMFWIFGNGIRRHQDQRLDSWEFTKKDTIFRIVKWEETKTFDMSYSLTPGSSWGFLTGNWIIKNDTLILRAEKYNMYIFNDLLINFRNDSSRLIIKRIIK